MASLHKLLVDVSFCCGFCTPPCLDDKVYIVSDQQLEYGLISFCELLFNFHILSGVRTWDAVRISRDAVRISWMQSEYSWNIENMLIYFSITF